MVVLDERQLMSLAAALGPEFRLDPQMSFEAVTMTTRYVIVHPATAFKIELFLLTNDPHDQARFARCRKVAFETVSAWLPRPEDVIVQKLRWFKAGKRAKEFEDGSEVFRVQRDALDLDYLRRWATEHKTSELLERLLTQP